VKAQTRPRTSDVCRHRELLPEDHCTPSPPLSARWSEEQRLRLTRTDRSSNHSTSHTGLAGDYVFTQAQTGAGLLARGLRAGRDRTGSRGGQYRRCPRGAWAMVPPTWQRTASANSLRCRTPTSSPQRRTTARTHAGRSSRDARCNKSPRRAQGGRLSAPLCRHLLSAAGTWVRVSGAYAKQAPRGRGGGTRGRGRKICRLVAVVEH